MIGTKEEQIRIEKDFIDKAVVKDIEELRKSMDSNTFHETRYGMVMTKLVYEPMVYKVNEYIATPTRGRGSVLKGLMLELCDNPKVLAYTTIISVISRVIKGRDRGASLTTVAYAVGSILVKDSIYKLVQSNNPKLYSYLHYIFKGASRERMAKIVMEHADDLYTNDLDNLMVISIGSKLIELLELSGANLITVGKSYVYSSRGKTNVVSLTQSAINLLLELKEDSGLYLKVNLPPMIVPPKPWTTNYDGGYITGAETFMKRVPHIDNEDEIQRLMTVVNKLQSTAWKVNTRVMGVMHDVLELDLPDPTNTTNIPRVIGGLPPSTYVDSIDVVKKEHFGKVDKDGRFINVDEWKVWNRAKEEMDVKLDADASRRLGLQIAMNLALEVIDYDKIYFPYAIDYRGRIYTQTNYLTPQGPSYIKSLLEFSEGQILNERGVYWLKVHTANSYGHDKLPYDERVAWVNNNMNAILDTGLDPLVHTSFWSYADKPYEFLACCFAMLDESQGKQVHLPIQLDATCSGIQLYSGLLLDRDGAESVNVIGNSRNDIYQKVADKVNHYLHTGDYPKSYEFKDKEGEEKIVTTTVEGSSMAGKITRKLTKRNTMTVPYSVTLRGMYDQLRDEFKDATLAGKQFWKGEEWVATKLLADLNHRAIYEVVLGARLGQEYLKEVGAVLGEQDMIVSYKTPIFNLQVTQRTYKTKKQRVNTYFGNLVLRNNTNEVDKRAQVNGIAPNVVHSLDATLLYLTVEKNSTGIGTNHDCFMVLPNQGDELQRNFRHSYVELMACKPLQFIGSQLCDSVEVPSVGTLDLQEVYDAKYIIS